MLLEKIKFILLLGNNFSLRNIAKIWELVVVFILYALKKKFSCDKRTFFCKECNYFKIKLYLCTLFEF